MSMEWNEFVKTFEITPEMERQIEFEKEIIETLVSIREAQGLSQAELATMANVKQPLIARLERGKHSPRIDSLLKLLVPLGYTLRIVKIDR